MIGSLDLLGNPVTFVGNLKEGVMDMIKDPYDSVMLSGEDLFTSFSSTVQVDLKQFL